MGAQCLTVSHTKPRIVKISKSGEKVTAASFSPEEQKCLSWPSDVWTGDIRFSGPPSYPRNPAAPVRETFQSGVTDRLIRLPRSPHVRSTLSLFVEMINDLTKLE